MVQIAKSQETNIGRSRANDICILQDEMVSRKHGKIIPRARCYMLEDLGSINGTFINTVRRCPLPPRPSLSRTSCAQICGLLRP
jgi:pSer/pThr/pTyr-binding forkhead associated (FHA) protein